MAPQVGIMSSHALLWPLELGLRTPTLCCSLSSWCDGLPCLGVVPGVGVISYLSQLGLTVHHIPGVKIGCSHCISRNNFDTPIRGKSEEFPQEAFACMDVHLHLNMTMICPLNGLQQAEYVKEFGGIYKRLEQRLEPILISKEQ